MGGNCTCHLEGPAKNIYAGSMPKGNDSANRTIFTFKDFIILKQFLYKKYFFTRLFTL